MIIKDLPSADDYFIFPHGEGHAIGFSKNGICYRLSESGEQIPVIYGDEFTAVYGEKRAVRNRQTIQII